MTRLIAARSIATVRSLLPLVRSWLLLAALGARSASAAPPAVLAADLHIHPVMGVSSHPLFQGMPGEPGPRAMSPGDILDNQVDLDELKRSGVRVLVASVTVPPALSPWVNPMDATLRQLEALRRWAGRHAAVQFCADAPSAEAAAARGKIVLIPAVEAADAVTSVDDIDRLYAAGARELQLVHFFDDAIAGGAAHQLRFALLDSHGTEKNPRGLSPLGRQVVKRMFELGMLVDLAHASDRTADEVLELAEAAHVPVIDSHSGARALRPGERSLSDAEAKRIVRGGGLLGVTLFRRSVEDVPVAERFAGFVPGTCDDAIAHWLYLAKQVGAEALALGSDFNGFAARPARGGSCPDGVRGTQDLPVFFAALKSHGFPEAALAHSGTRLLEIWREVEARANPAAQARARKADGAPSLERPEPLF